MTVNIETLKSTTFMGKRFTRNQLVQIQETVTMFTNLSLRELANTICEHFQWITPKGTYRVHFCISILEELESIGLFKLPKKREKKKTLQKKIIWTNRSKEQESISCEIADLLPLRIEVITNKEYIKEWNEFVDRYHYLGYKRPIGCHLRYFIVSKTGKKLGCLLFSYAVQSLPCREQWIGWTSKEQLKNLELVINNNRFLVFPWVNVENLASKSLSLVSNQIADDWEEYHGYRPMLLETFVDPTKYRGTCYKASNWQYIGKSAGKKSGKDKSPQKEYYVYPLSNKFLFYLKNTKKIPKTKVPILKNSSKKSEELTSDNPFIGLWQRIIDLIFSIANEYDQKWQKRRRVLNTMLIILFVFRLVFSKNKQGYLITISELWEQCKKMKVPLPQSKPVAASAFCAARNKLDENIFKEINTKTIEEYEDLETEYKWNNLRIFATDGTKINLPRQLLDFGYKTPTDNTYYPQGLVSCLYQLKSKIPYDFDLVSHYNERAVALSHLQVLKNHDVVVYDRGYFSYAMLYYHIKQNIHSVFRIKNKSFHIIKEFITSSDTDKTVEIIPSNRHQRDIRLNYPEIVITPLKIRLIKYTIADIEYILGTTLIDNQIYKATDFPDLYHSRWGVEELYKISKVLIDVEDFHAQSERGVKQELFAHFVLITLSRFFANKSDQKLIKDNNSLANNSNSNRCEETKINFKNCLITIARSLEGLFIKQTELVRQTINKIISSVSMVRQKERPNRTYKRHSFKPENSWKKRKNKSAIKATIV